MFFQIRVDIFLHLVNFTIDLFLVLLGELTFKLSTFFADDYAGIVCSIFRSNDRGFGATSP
jgi:hypothetical protein